MAIQIDVVVVVIDRVDESPAFIHFVGMLVGSCFKHLSVNREILDSESALFKARGYYHAHKFLLR